MLPLRSVLKVELFPLSKDAQHERLRGARVAAEHGHPCLGKALIQLHYVGDGRVGSRGEGDDEPLRLGARGGEVAEVDGRGTKAELTPGDPVEAEVDALDERVLGDDQVVAELRRVVLDA